MKHQVWRDLAALGRRELSKEQMTLLSTYQDWLASEAFTSGGIGPGEVDRLEIRHIGDSLLFATVFDDDPVSVWDLGSGVGLPGIPLGILLPNTQFHLLDRSGRRVDLANRAVRILGLDNVSIETTDIELLSGTVDVLVSRASLPPERLAIIAKKTLVPGGLAVIGGSWEQRPSHPEWETVEIPPDPLDQPVWLLMMRRQ